MLKIFAKGIILFIAIWSIGVVVVEIMGITIYFPFHFSPNHEIPNHRLQAGRLCQFIIIPYFVIKYLIWGGVKLYPSQFLDIYIKILTIVSILVFIKVDVIKNELFYLLFLVILSICTHIASKPKYRNYFVK